MTINFKKFLYDGMWRSFCKGDERACGLFLSYILEYEKREQKFYVLNVDMELPTGIPGRY